jgi:methionyl-tRNA formyltransferase
MTTRIVFMGTPEFAVPALQALIDSSDFDVVGVVTQPDRPAGRGNQLRQSAVKELALKVGIEIFQPEKLRGEEVMQRLEAWSPDFHVVAAYGQILRQAVLDLPTYGSINVHASLLPRWRGAAPIQAAILAGDAQTGITIMQMDAGLDTGPMLSTEAVDILPSDTSQTLHDKLAAISGPLLTKTLCGVISGDIQPQHQNNELSTYAPRIEKEEGKIIWANPVEQIDRQIRAYSPWPAAFTTLDSTLLKIAFGYPILDNPSNLQPGQIATDDPDAPLIIGTGNGRYAPARLQLAGRKEMGVVDFLNGLGDLNGTILG